MLVLTRRNGESVRIGPDVRITVVSTSGGQVRIGIEAPAQVAVHREEVWERIARANREAASAPEDLLAALERGAAASRSEAEEEGSA